MKQKMEELKKIQAKQKRQQKGPRAGAKATAKK